MVCKIPEEKRLLGAAYVLTFSVCLATDVQVTSIARHAENVVTTVWQSLQHSLTIVLIKPEDYPQLPFAI